MAEGGILHSRRLRSRIQRRARQSDDKWCRRVQGAADAAEIETEASQRRADDTGEKGGHPDNGESFRLDVQIWKYKLAELTEEQSQLGSQYKHGGKQAPRCPRRIGYGAEPEPEQENERKQAERIGSDPSALRNRIAAANKVGRDAIIHHDCCADQPRTQLDEPPVELADRINRT